MISTAHNLSKLVVPIFSATCFGLSSAICSIGIKLAQASITSYKKEPNELYSTTLQRLFQEDGIEILKNMVAAFTSACTTSALSIAFFNGEDTFGGNETNETTGSYTTAASTTNLLETDILEEETALKIAGSCVIGVGVHLITSEAIRAFITLSNKYVKGNSQSSRCQLPKSEELSTEGLLKDVASSSMGLLPDVVSELLMTRSNPGYAALGQLGVAFLMSGMQTGVDIILRRTDKKTVLKALAQIKEMAELTDVQQTKLTEIESKITTHGNSRDEIRDLGKELDDLTKQNITAFSPHYKKPTPNPATVVTIVQDLPSPKSKFKNAIRKVIMNKRVLNQFN